MSIRRYSLYRHQLVASTLAAAAALTGGMALAQQGDGTDVPIKTHIFKPDKVPATAARLAAIKAPSGFHVKPFASGLGNARIIAVNDDGTIYVTRRDEGDVLMLKDADGDGVADGPAQVVAHRSGAHGLALHDGKLYLVTVHELFVADINRDGTLGELKLLIGDLPDGGQHGNRTVAWGPDDMLYLSVGSTCNTCNESSPDSATILRISPDGKRRNIFASGLRNTIGFDWQPGTGELWGFDNGIDYLGDEVQQEELNHIEAGKRYGWPHVSGAGDIYPQSTPVGGISKTDWKAGSTPMVLGYAAHAAPMQLVFDKGATNFPDEYAGDAFVTMRGSWNRVVPSGYNIVRVHFENGQAKSITPFASGFLSDGGRKHFARPMGLAFAKDGSLLMADDANGTIYRISYDGPNPGRQKKLDVPADSMKRQTSKGFDVPLAVQRPETDAKGKLEVKSAAFEDGGKLEVKSAAFEDGGKLDKRYSNYADNVSPDLQWSAVQGAQSYVVLVEDPDAKPVQPIVHWLAWNIPASVTSLPEGVQAQPRLTAPEGVLQGTVTRGSTGYTGPRPPVGDSPHCYHFEVLALDKSLDVPLWSDRDTVLAAATGHVIAKGEIIGRYAQAEAPPK